MERLIGQASEIVALLKRKNRTVAVAESCTGGLLAGLITAVSGASAVFDTGVVAYGKHTKQKVLGVSAETLRETGTVSRQTAAEMASGVRRLAGADIGIGITGVAGPDSVEGKPVGRVYIALTDGHHIRVNKLDIREKTRNEVRLIACSAALQMIRNRLVPEEADG